MVDIDISHYSTGTATVGSNGTAVTGQGTAWVGAVRPGDLFGTHVGLPIRILSVESNTSLTLAHPWPGDAQAAAPYEIQRSPYELGYQRAVEELIAGISEGNVPLLAALTAAANKLPYFDSSSSMALADLSPFARTLLDDADAGAALSTLDITSFWQGRITVDADAAAAREGLGANDAGNLTAGLLPNARVRDDLPPDKAFRRGNILGTVSQSGGVPTGAIIERGSNANGEYIKFADGTLICTAVREHTTGITTAVGSVFTSSNQTWTYPHAFLDGSAPTQAGSSISWYANAWFSLGTSGSVSRTGMSFALKSPTSLAGNAAGRVSLLAIGRWF